MTLSQLVAWAFLLAGCAAAPTTQPMQSGDWIVSQVQDARTGEIVIPSGRYLLPHTLQIDTKEHLRLRGDGAVTLLVEDVMSPVVSISHSERVLLEGLQCRHVAPLTEYECHGAVVEVRQSGYVTVRGCHLDGCGAIGFHAADSHNLKVTGCGITNNTFNAVYLADCEWVQIINNRIHGNGNTFQLSGGEFIEIWGNEIRANGGYWEEREWSD